MKKLLCYIAIVLVGTALLDGIFRIFCNQAYHSSTVNSYVNYQYKFIYYDQPADLAILGASRANHHYVSKQIEDSLNIEVYNWGGDAQNILVQYLCFLKALENGHLKTVILDLSMDQIGEWVKSHLSFLYPYYWNNDTIKNLVDEVNGMNMSPFMISSFVQYNSKFSGIVKSHKRKIDDQKGFYPIPYKGKPYKIKEKKKEVSEVTTDVKFDPIGIKYLIEMDSISRQNGIRFAVCISPYLYYEKMGKADIIKICHDNNIECWDMSEEIKDPYLYKDIIHLNVKGAKLFTEMVIKKLRN